MAVSGWAPAASVANRSSIWLVSGAAGAAAGGAGAVSALGELRKGLFLAASAWEVNYHALERGKKRTWSVIGREQHKDSQLYRKI